MLPSVRRCTNFYDLLEAFIVAIRGQDSVLAVLAQSVADNLAAVAVQWQAWDNFDFLSGMIGDVSEHS